MDKYSKLWAPKPAIALGALVGASIFLYFATSSEQEFIGKLFLWFFFVLTIAIALGSSISTFVKVDSDSNFIVRKKIAGINFSNVNFKRSEVLCIELDKQLSTGGGPSPKTGDGSMSRKITPRYKINLVHNKGIFLVVASSDDLRSPARSIADALNCNVKKTGRWE